MTAFLVALILPTLGGAAETGDFDGDGRLSIADVIAFQERVSGCAEAAPDLQEAMAPGSLEGFFADPWFKALLACYPSCPTFLWDYRLPATVYLESLRRMVSGSLP